MNGTSTALAVAVVAFIGFVALLLICESAMPTMDRVEWEETIYKVKKGDTLWAISGEYCPDNVDRQEWINQVHLLNDLPDSIIHPGQRLTVLKPMED